MKPPTRVAKSKNNKATVDVVDFLALRAELVDMRARLDESEQARAIVEARLSSLDATAAAFGNERNDISEVTNMVQQLQQQIADRPAATGGGDAAANSGAHDELSAKVDALQNRLFGLQDHAPKIAEFEAQLAQLSSELEIATAAAAEAAALPPPPPSVSGPDPETLERIAAVQQRVNDLDQIRHRLGEIEHLKLRVGELDQLQLRVGELDQLHERVTGVESLHERVGELDDVAIRLAMVDGLAAQLQQLNARVSAQAELGGQVSALRDRMTQLTDQPSGADDEIRLQLQEIGERLRASEAAQAEVGELAARVAVGETEARAVRDHMAKLDQRVTNVGTELANQLSELGRDIDGLAQRVPEAADGGVSEEVVDELRDSQVKLANEQARYEIAFRQDLAALAEQLRHARDDD
jgi:DNA repair exonuclease SbcCD ATPase subunit